MRYLARRFLHAAMLLAATTVVTFLFTTLAPGNYFDEMRLNPQISPETLTALKARYDLDKPLPVRYLVWVKSLAHGEMGYSFAYNSPVLPLVAVRARNTLLLTITATLLAWLIALPLGVWSAEYAGRWLDHVITGTSAILLVIPDIALALGFLLIAVQTRWFPAGGMASVGAESLPFANRLWDLAQHMFLPATILVLIAQPILVRHIRAAVADVLGEGFIRAAEAHGIPRSRLLWRYALPAAANPLISLFGFSIGALLSGSLLVEVVTSWPGLGPFLLEAILARDLYVVIGGVLLSTVFLVAGNFIADVALFWADPRIRTE
ncbi:MAG TPA: ABC transporter permease [Candidatus Dormibacteraeota bacterium]|nr:ABC transporter permease [Candidatus Dormibacteraeota bacterium]